MTKSLSMEENTFQIEARFELTSGSESTHWHFSASEVDAVQHDRW